MNSPVHVQIRCAGSSHAAKLGVFSTRRFSRHFPPPFTSSFLSLVFPASPKYEESPCYMEWILQESDLDPSFLAPFPNGKGLLFLSLHLGRSLEVDTPRSAWSSVFCYHGGRQDLLSPSFYPYAAPEVSSFPPFLERFLCRFCRPPRFSHANWRSYALEAECLFLCCLRVVSACFLYAIPLPTGDKSQRPALPAFVGSGRSFLGKAPSSFRKHAPAG